MQNTSNTQQENRAELWPALPYEAWKETYETLHMWTQIVGKVRMKRYRSPFVGKSSPVQLFWGSFDLAVTLFSGRRAPERPGADHVMREAASHEAINCGFWPGDERFPAPAFYAYTYPEPPGLLIAAIRPEQAFYSHDMGEFLLRYDDVRSASSPEQALLAFFQSTYEAGARLAQ